MKKLMLLLSCSLFAAQTAQALSAAEQMNAMRDVFAHEFQKMDEDNDGVLNMEEFLKYQFEEFRHTVAQSQGFELPSEQNQIKAPAKKVSASEVQSVDEQPVVNEAETVKQPEPAQTEDKTPAESLDALNDVSQTLQAMADYDENWDDDYDYDALLAEDKIQTPLSDVDDKTLAADEAKEPLPELPEIDFSLSEEETLQNMLKDEAKKENPETPAEKEAKNKQIKFMLDTIQATLPKKVDDITTWTGIEFENDEITYIYQADVDTSKFSPTEKETLKNSVETIACAQAYAQMCPKVKTMFIDKGVSMKIRYLDQLENEISACVFNEKTCQ